LSQFFVVPVSPDPGLQGTGNGTLCYQVPPWFINAVHEHSTLVAPLSKIMKTQKNKEVMDDE